MTLSGTENLPVESAIGSSRGFYTDRLRRTLADKSATKLNLLKAVHDYLREREQRIGVGLSVESDLFEDMPEPFRGLLNYNKFKRQLTLNHRVVDADIWKIEYGYIKLDNMTNNEIIFLLLGLLLGLQIALLIQTYKTK